MDKANNKETASVTECDPLTGCQKEIVHFTDSEGRTYTDEKVIRNGEESIKNPRR